MILIALAFILFILLLVAHANRTKTHIPPKRTEQQEVDELITVILPTINHDR